MKRAVLALILLTTPGGVFAGPDFNQLVFPTKNGIVTFMHADHQAAEKDCTTCHPGGKAGKIPGFGKDAAHKLCIDCHKQKGGPTTCSECHEK